jgi:hypothetical protein
MEIRVISEKYSPKYLNLCGQIRQEEIKFNCPATSFIWNIKVKKSNGM